MFFTLLYVHKKVYVFLMKKKNFYMVDLAQNSKTFSNCQATYQKELCLKNHPILFPERMYR